MKNIRCLLTWWGCLDRGEETIGDLFAVARTARLLRAWGFSVEIATCVPYVELGENAIVVKNPLEINPDSFDILGFVCGPLISDSAAFQQMLNHFSKLPKFAVGVSVLPNGWNPFDRIVARDGTSNNFGDFAFSPSEFKKQDNNLPKDSIGICLRGMQFEYGAENCLWNSAQSMIDTAMSNCKATVKYLDTRLHSDLNASQRIIEEFQECKVIISTRLHGALLGLTLGRPVIALDQLAEGQKVTSVLNQLGWSFVAKVSEPKFELKEVLCQCEQSNIIDAVELAQTKMTDSVRLITWQIENILKELIQ